MTLPSLREHNDLNKQQFVGGVIFLFLCECVIWQMTAGMYFLFFDACCVKDRIFYITLSMEQKGTFAYHKSVIL